MRNISGHCRKDPKKIFALHVKLDIVSFLFSSNAVQVIVAAYFPITLIECSKGYYKVTLHWADSGSSETQICCHFEPGAELVSLDTW